MNYMLLDALGPYFAVTDMVTDLVVEWAFFKFSEHKSIFDLLIICHILGNLCLCTL